VLGAIAAAGRRFRLLAIADAAPAMPPGVPVEAVRWTADGWEDALARCHVGVAPLPDDPWTRGKCGLKVLQMLAVGRPVVASAVGVQRDQVRHGETGFVAQGPEEVRRAIETLLDDRALREEMGESARHDARNRWSVEAWAPKVVEEVERVLR
jgi:glycosyltransferase involved in cell wall biosynthesis